VIDGGIRAEMHAWHDANNAAIGEGAVEAAGAAIAAVADAAAAAGNEDDEGHGRRNSVTEAEALEATSASAPLLELPIHFLTTPDTIEDADKAEPPPGVDIARYKKLGKVPSSTIAAIAALDGTGLCYLAMDRHVITAIPVGLCLPSLHTLDLCDNKITGIPDEIALCTQLTTLVLKNNKIQELPVSMRTMQKLVFLQLRNNELVRIPTHFEFPPNLMELYLERNGLEELPIGIGWLKELKVLMLSENKLARLPHTVGLLAKLEELDLRNNVLVSLPRQIAGMRSLKKCVLRMNRLTSLPPEIGMIKDLEYLDLDMNDDRLLDKDGVYGVLKRSGTQAAIRSFSADITWTHYLHPVLGNDVNRTVYTVFMCAYCTETSGLLVGLPVELWLKIIEMLTVRYLGFV